MSGNGLSIHTQLALTSPNTRFLALGSNEVDAGQWGSSDDKPQNGTTQGLHLPKTSGNE